VSQKRIKKHKEEQKQDVSITLANLLEKPGTGIGPMAIGCSNRNAENLCCLVDA